MHEVRPPSAHVPQRSASFSQGQQTMFPTTYGEATAFWQSGPVSATASGPAIPLRQPGHPVGVKSLPVSPPVSPQAQFARPLSSGSGLGRGSSSPTNEQQPPQRPPSPPATSTMLSGFQAKPSSSATQQRVGSVSPAQSASVTERPRVPFATGSRGSVSSVAAALRSAPPSTGSFAEALHAEALAAAAGGAPAGSSASSTTEHVSVSASRQPAAAQSSAAPLPAPRFAPIPLDPPASGSTAAMDPPQTLGKRKRTVQETVQAWKRLAHEIPLNNVATPAATTTAPAVRSSDGLATQSGQPSHAPVQQTVAAAHRRDSAPPISPSGLVTSQTKPSVLDVREVRVSGSQPPASETSQSRRRKTSSLKPPAPELKGISLPGDENMTDEGYDKVLDETLEAIRGFEQARAQFSVAWEATPARAGEPMPGIAQIRHRAPRDVVSASPWRDGKKQVCPSKSASLDLEAAFGDFLPLPACSATSPAPNIVQPIVRFGDPIYAWRPFPTVGANNQPPAIDLTYTAKPCPATGPLQDIIFLTPRLFLPWPEPLAPITPAVATSSHSHLKSLEAISRKRIDAEILEGRLPADDGEAYAEAVRRHLFHLVYGAIKDGKMNGLGNLKAPRLAKATRKKVAQVMAEGGVSAPTPAERIDAEAKAASAAAQTPGASTLAQSTSAEVSLSYSTYSKGRALTGPSLVGVGRRCKVSLDSRQSEDVSRVFSRVKRQGKGALS